jgi:hypothetical protein
VLLRKAENGDPLVIATVQLDGGDLTAEVNSDERADELRRLVAAALPDAELVDDDVRTFAQMRREASRLGTRPADIEPDDPALQAVLAEVVAEMERRWLDESIPALGGKTPREAAQDPVGREELRQLLATLPPTTGYTAMSPQRLRVALELDDEH